MLQHSAKDSRIGTLPWRPRPDLAVLPLFSLGGWMVCLADRRWGNGVIPLTKGHSIMVGTQYLRCISSDFLPALFIY